MEFQVNTASGGDRYNPAAAMGSSGFLIVWDGPGTGDAGVGVFARRFGASGDALGTEFRVNTYTTNSQDYPAVAALPAGYVVVWSAFGQGGAVNTVLYDIRGQRLDASGAKLGAEFLVNSTTLDQQDQAKVGAASSGQFVVVWQTYGQDGPTSYAVYGKRFAASGAPLGDEFRVNATTAGDQRLPAVGVAASGAFVVVWVETDVIFGRRFGANGAPLGDQFEVSTINQGSKSDPVIALDGSGGFFVVWSAEGDIPQSYGIYGRRYASDGSPLTDDEFQLNTAVSGDQDYPSVALVSSTEFVVTWTTATDVGYGFVFDGAGQRFSTNGPPVGSEFRVNTATGDEDKLSVASAGAGRLVIAWQSGPTYPAAGTASIHAQRFGAFSAGVKGDADGNGVLNVSDVLYLINHLFAGGPAPIGPADADGNGVLNVSDVLYLINHLFAGGPPPV